MADDVDEDQILHEVDVFLAKSLVEKLYLLQFPVRPSSVSYDRTPHLAARVKPKGQKVELEVGINTDSNNYCITKGEEIAFNTDGANANKEPYFMSDRMDKQVLKSTKVGTDTNRYAVGILRPGELHVTPVHGMLQMRPSFEYLDRQSTTPKHGATKDDAESQDEEEEAKPLTVRFAKPESERAKNARLSSFKYLEQKDAEEPWSTVDFHQPYEEVSIAEQQALYCREVESDSTDLCLSTREYLKLLTPGVTTENRSKPELPDNVIPIAHIKSLSLGEQVSTLMKNAKVMQFNQLCSLLSTMDEQAVIRCLQQCAMLVQGCWVVKSELLYPKGSTSAYSGVGADILCRGRDYLMWSFTQSRYVVRKEIAAVIKLPSDDVKEMLEQMARMKVSRGWEFILPYDKHFVTKHPEPCKQQTLLWNNKHQLMVKSLNLQKQDKTASSIKQEKKDNEPKSPRKAARNTKSKATASTTISVESYTQPVLVEDGQLQEETNSSESVVMDMDHSNGDTNLATEVLIKGEPLDDDIERTLSMNLPTDLFAASQRTDSPNMDINRPLLFNNNINVINKDASATPVLRGACVSVTNSPSVNSQDSGMESLSQSTDVEMTDLDNGTLDTQHRDPMQSLAQLLSYSTNAVQDRPVMDDQMLRELGNFVRDKIQRNVVSFTELKRMLLLRQTVHEPGDILCSGVSDAMLEEAILHVGASEIQIKWPHTLSANANAGSRKFFAFRKVGDEELDQYREVILDLFKETFSIRKKDIKDKCEQLLGSQPSPKDFTKLSQELLEKGKGKGTNSWFLKGTLSTQ